MTESGAPPVEQTKKPLDQTVLACLPQKNEPNALRSAEADFDFRIPMTLERHAAGGASNRKWMWSSSPLISVISHWISVATARRVSNRKSRFSEVSI